MSETNDFNQLNHFTRKYCCLIFQFCHLNSSAFNNQSEYFTKTALTSSHKQMNDLGKIWKPTACSGALTMPGK
jgi:hypothetical protein